MPFSTLWSSLKYELYFDTLVENVEPNMLFITVEHIILGFLGSVGKNAAMKQDLSILSSVY